MLIEATGHINQDSLEVHVPNPPIAGTDVTMVSGATLSAATGASGKVCDRPICGGTNSGDADRLGRLVRGIAWCVLVGLGLVGCSTIPPTTDERPGAVTPSSSVPASSVPANSVTAISAPANIVVVLSDDQRYDTLGVTGHPFIKTPHIDRLAREGAEFPNSFVVTSLCLPSRATLLTGRYTHRTKVTGNEGPNRNPEASMVLRLREAGYRTAFFGKYHLDDCTPRPEFDHWECLAGRVGQGHYFDGNLNVNGVMQPFEGHSTDAVGERASTWIAAQGDRPFFALVSLKNPHHPLTPPARHNTLYEDIDVTPPASANDSPDALPTYVRAEMTAPAYAEELRNSSGNTDPLPDILRRYARMIPSIDDVVGRIDTTLDDTGLRETTLLVFTSDNGILLGEHGIIRKKLAYEASIRVPLAMRLPGRIPPGARPDNATLNVDLAATFLDAAGIDLEPSLGLDGLSLLSLFEQPAAEWRQDWVYIAPHRRKKIPPFLATRTDRWKYIRYAGPPVEEELFDLAKDPEERHNRAADPASKDQLEAMRQRLWNGMRDLEVPLTWFPTSDEPAIE